MEGQKNFGDRLRIVRRLLIALALSAFFLWPIGPGAGIVGPMGDYTESGGDRVQLCASLDASYNCVGPTNTFAVGSTVYVRVETNRAANASVTNTIKIFNYNNATAVANSTFTQRSSSPPYVYTGSIVIPSNTTKYSKIQGQVQSASANFTFEEAFEIPSISNQYIRVFRQSGQQNESYCFQPSSTVYIAAYGTGQAANGSNFLQLRSFDNTIINTVNPGTVTPISNIYSMTYTMPALGGSVVDGNWYWLETKLVRGASALQEQMSRMVQIDGSAPTASISSPAANACLSGSVNIIGTATDLYSFYNYIVEYGIGASPSSWTEIGSSTSPVSDGTLQAWDTTGVADGVYTIRLTVNDRAEYQSRTTKLVTVENNAPVISSLAAQSITSTSAAINWSTDGNADSLVEYDTDSGQPYDYSVSDASPVSSHTLSLSSLQPDTTLYYRVRSTDCAGNQTWSGEMSFQTARITVLQPFPTVAMDTIIETGYQTYNFGTATSLSAGYTSSAGVLRGLLRFDLSGIPSSANIVSANLSLYQMGQQDTSMPSVSVHYLTRNWTEGTGTGSATGDGATWLTYNGVNSWTIAGGDYNATVSATVSAPNSTGAWVQWSLTSLVQSWVNGTITNYGAAIRQDTEDAVNDAKNYYTSDYTVSPSLRPKLTIEWTGTDSTAPAIGEIQAKNITQTSADILWSTDESSTSQVDYGTTISYGTSTTLDTNLTNQHTMNLSGLTSNTLYHYRVRSKDSSGNEAVTADQVFRTARLLTIEPTPLQGSDTWISGTSTSLNYGASQDIAIGSDTGSRRGLLRFDLSRITAGSTINSATLSLYQHAQSDSSVYPLGVYAISRSWTEGSGNGTTSGDGATWSTYNGSSGWTSSGGDFDATVKATANVANSTGDWIDFDLTSLTSDWVNGALSNNGMLLKKTDEGSGSGDFKTFYSSDNTNALLRPKLVIEYVPSPSSIIFSIDETYNYDGTAGYGGCNFGNITGGASAYIGSGASPQYAVKITIASNSTWGLKVSAIDDLKQANPAILMDIPNLYWKNDADPPASYQSFVKSPSETVISSGMEATGGTSYWFDYRLSAPSLATSGSYSTVITYTAYNS